MQHQKQDVDSLYGTWGIENKIKIKQSNDGLHLVGIDDVDYGIINDSKLITYNPEYGMESDGVISTYELSHVESIGLSPDSFYFEVRTFSDNPEGPSIVHKHAGKVGRDDAQTIIPDTTVKSLDTVIDMIRRYYPAWHECICSDAFTGEPWVNTLILGQEPSWKSITGPDNGIVLEMCRNLGTKDNSEYAAANGQKVGKFKVSKGDVYDALLWFTWRNPKNLFLERISRRQWDGIHRIDTFYKELGCSAHLSPEEDEEYLKNAGRVTFLAPLQRLMQKTPVSIPIILLFIGDQHVGKSDVCKMLGLMDWHTEFAEEIKKQEDLYYNTNGKVIVELAEAVAFKKTGFNTMKAVADQSSAHFRTKYDRNPSTHPLTATYIITTNDESLLTDDTGNRRYLPIFFDKSKAVMTTLDYGMTPFDPKPNELVYQLWAEALEMYAQGIRWGAGMMSENGFGFKKLYADAQEQAVYNEPWEIALMEWLDAKHPLEGDMLTNLDIRDCLKDNAGLYGEELNICMRKIGHSTKKFHLKKLDGRPTTKRVGGKVTKYVEYVRTNAAEFDVDDGQPIKDSTLDSYADDDPLDLHYS